MSEFVKLTLAEQDWTFRALDLDQIEALEPAFMTVSAMGLSATSVPKAGFAAVAEIAAESLKYKHPDMTLAQCRKLITLGTMHQVIEAVRGVSALEPQKGEAPAGQA